jgi:hypothetical protein
MGFKEDLNSLFKSSGEGGSQNKIDTNLINKWTNYAKQLGLNDTEILGMAYLNACIPTVVYWGQGKVDLIKPLKKVILNFMQNTHEGADILSLYRELFFNASIRDSALKPINYNSAPSGYFSPKNNKYLKYKGVDDNVFKNSELIIDLIGNLGQILKSYNVDIIWAFNLGHLHTNYLMRVDFDLFVRAVIMSNVVPEYIGSLMDSIPDSSVEQICLRDDLWIFSKVLRYILGHSNYDLKFQEWIWTYHNRLFYEDKPNSLKIKDQCDISNENFDYIIVLTIYKSIIRYYQARHNVGKQFVNKIEKPVLTDEQFVNKVNDRLSQDYSIRMHVKDHRNIGEKTNYLCFIFLKSIEVSFENFNFN